MRKIDADLLREHISNDIIETREDLMELVEDAPTIKDIWQMPPAYAFQELIKYMDEALLKELTGYLNVYIEHHNKK